jgi:hypothetical protein
MTKRFASALLAIMTILGLGVIATPAQADSGFVPISADDSSSSKPLLNKKHQLTGASNGVSALAAYNYQYTYVTYDDTHTGISWDMNVESPWKSPLEAHTLSQVAICKDGSVADCIEFGWIKSEFASACPAGNTAVCMFIGYRVGGTFAGYNAGAYYHDNPSNTTIHRQISLNGAVGGQRNWRVVHNAAQNRWDVIYGTGPNGTTWNDVVGWIDDAAWSNTFTSSGFSEIYTEITSDQRVQSAQCTDAGTNVLPSSTAGHRVWNIDLLGVTGEVMDTAAVSPSGLTGRGAVKVSNSEARLGGPGPC